MDGLRVTREMIDSFLSTRNTLKAETLKTYENRLGLFYETLPEDKTICRGTIRAVAEQLLNEGYAKKSLNVLLSVADSFVVWCDRPELQSAFRMKEDETILPELTRSEYQRLLMAAKQMDRERTYLCIKTIALTGVNLMELLAMTVADAERGMVRIGSEIRRIPGVLQQELLAYIRRNHIPDGTLFLTRSGSPIKRSSITRSITTLADVARVDENKCNPRCLRKLYLDTQERYREMLRMLVDQAEDRQLEQEQRLSGWNAS